MKWRLFVANAPKPHFHRYAEVSVNRHQAIWNARFEKVLRGEYTLVGEPWLERWLKLVPQGENMRALDVGCGSGHNTRLLVEHGFEVTAIDFSERALELCKREAPRAHMELADIRDGLPIAGSHFDLIVADLSLHYFSWELTRTIVSDIANGLVPEGLFAARFNSTNDENYGSGSDEPVPRESNLFIVEGIEKRFFTEGCLNSLFGPPWRTVSLVEKTSLRFGPPKVLWELVATKIVAS